ncbi:hypothetical protein TNCV_2752401 [Trichonephila clavipes]|nr:hypothetical protein TNCV_2752401 [Trichonephila clavipes]
MPIVSLSFEHHEGKRTIWLLYTPILTENTLRAGSLCSPFHPPYEKELRLDDYLDYLHAAKPLYIYKHPCLIRDSNPDPTALRSVSPTTVPGGWKAIM